MSYAEEEEMWKEQEQRQMTQGATVGAGYVAGSSAPSSRTAGNGEDDSSSARARGCQGVAGRLPSHEAAPVG